MTFLQAHKLVQIACVRECSNTSPLACL